jgi:hypothetical protein
MSSVTDTINFIDSMLTVVDELLDKGASGRLNTTKESLERFLTEFEQIDEPDFEHRLGTSLNYMTIIENYARILKHDSDALADLRSRFEELKPSESAGPDSEQISEGFWNARERKKRGLE